MPSHHLDRFSLILLADDRGLSGLEAAFKVAVLQGFSDLPAAVADAVRRETAFADSADLRELYRGVLDRQMLFAGRAAELRILDNEAAIGGRYVCLSAPARFGKSTLLAHWVRGGTDVAFVFLSRLAGTADEVPTLQALCQPLLDDRDVPLRTDPADLRAGLSGLLARPPQPHAPAVAIIDGIDEADWQLTGLLPTIPPAGRLIVLSRRADNRAWVREPKLPDRVVTRAPNCGQTAKSPRLLDDRKLAEPLLYAASAATLYSSGCWSRTSGRAASGRPRNSASPPA